MDIMIPPKGMPTVVLHTGGLRFGDEKVVVERVLGHQPGVLAVSANPVSQTANVTFDPLKTSVAQLRRWIEDESPWVFRRLWRLVSCHN